MDVEVSETDATLTANSRSVLRIRGWRSAHDHPEVAQLGLVHGGRGTGQRVLPARGLGERDRLADVDLAGRAPSGEHRDEAVEPQGDAAVRRCAVVEGVEQEA